MTVQERNVQIGCTWLFHIRSMVSQNKTEQIISPFTHTDFSGKLPVNCRKEIMCEQDLLKNTGKFVPAIYQYEKL